jgi:hypothetical protein
MKTLKNLMIASLSVFFGFCLSCEVESADISGTYVNHAESEFSIADDTLIVERVEGLDYLIHRRTGFRQIDELGSAGKAMFEVEEWKGIYDAGSASMTENRKGRVISFDIQKGLLTLERASYRRIN